jgi:phenylpropionate dioxygenase-like ring-hydroxylating dioxygenase large terminal subunit
MAEQWELEAIERISQLAGGQDTAETTSSIPIETYTSRERCELEKQRVLATVPLVVGFSCQVKNPGDFFTHDLSGKPILVSRDDDGQLHAFLNVCRHRGARVVGEASGSRKGLFRCGYHGWSYEGNGALRAIPQSSVGFPEVRCADRGLVPLPVEEVGGIVFVSGTPGSKFHARESLGPLAHELETFGLASRVLYEKSRHQVACNWKLMVEPGLESYHIPVLHKDTGATFLEGPLISKPYGPHARFLLPFKEEMMGLSALLDVPAILKRAAVAFTFYPNTIVLLLGELAHVLSTYPVDESHCVVEGRTLAVDRARDETAAMLVRFNYDGYWATIREDIAIAETVQRGLASGANRELIVGRHEFPIATFHSALDAALAVRS